MKSENKNFRYKTTFWALFFVAPFLMLIDSMKMAYKTKKNTGKFKAAKKSNDFFVSRLQAVAIARKKFENTGLPHYVVEPLPNRFTVVTGRYLQYRPLPIIYTAD
ncbi:MAG: hypothetical protein PF590_01260 [Candidatus Delongbacteria bacterium]|jgi:hypothetical protein|nr:hypothetical protein [Candidatus Delongbacteria bacterium]